MVFLERFLPTYPCKPKLCISQLIQVLFLGFNECNVTLLRMVLIEIISLPDYWFVYVTPVVEVTKHKNYFLCL